MLQVEYAELTGNLKATLDDLLDIVVTPEKLRLPVELVIRLALECRNDKSRFGQFVIFEAPNRDSIKIHALVDGGIVIVNIKLNDLKSRPAPAGRPLCAPGELLQ